MSWFVTLETRTHWCRIIEPMPTPIERVAKWFAERKDVPRQCRYGLNIAAEGERCQVKISARESERLGHPGFCSHEHAVLDQENALM
jgi:hypothetical protein